MDDLRERHFYNRSNIRPIPALSHMPLLVTQLADTFAQMDGLSEKIDEARRKRLAGNIAISPPREVPDR